MSIEKPMFYDEPFDGNMSDLYAVPDGLDEALQISDEYAEWLAGSGRSPDSDTYREFRLKRAGGNFCEIAWARYLLS